jgi:hypothetical protein
MTRTPNNIYILNEIEEERCCLGKEDETWIWNMRMGHIHFDNLVKISKKQVVREMPKITKPTNIMCKHCQHGKQNLNSIQRNTIQQNHWRLYTLIYVGPREQKD